MEKPDIVELISSLLNSGKYKEALTIPFEEKFKTSFKDNCWDLVSVVIKKVEDNTVTIKPSLYGACEELLSIIVQEAVPEEALLEFIEQIETAQNDAQFSMILSPLQKLLVKLSSKRGRSLEWSLNSISTYIESIPIKEHKLEGKERLLMDSDANIRRISKVYSLLPPFYEPFIKELNNSTNKIETKQIIASFLISLLGSPLIYIDLDPEINVNSELRCSSNLILQDICTVEKDVVKLLKYMDICFKENKLSKPQKNLQENEEGLSPYDNRDKVNMTTLSGLFYMVFSGHFEIPKTSVPLVYQTDYIVHSTLLAVIYLLGFSEYGPLAKAIALCTSLLHSLPDNLSHTYLLNPIHYDLCKALANIAIFSNFESIRKKAVNIIGYQINKFDYRGRCSLIKNLIDVSNHSGMIGYAITIYKNSLDQALKEPILNECFTGTHLIAMVKKICHLPHGAETDLVEHADQIISTLNFLRYIALKDIKNSTGIRDWFTFIENDYLETLRTGLKMSRAHYEIKLKDIQEGKSLEEDVNVSVNVGGNVLDKIPAENKKQVIHSALNVFHLMDGLVARLSECININKMQNLSMDCN